MKKYMKWFLGYSTALTTISFVALLEDFRHPTHAGTLALRVTGQVLHGRLNGQFQGRSIALQTNVLKPGDVLLCHNSDGAYGYWTHAVMYVGSGRVVDAFSFSNGTLFRPVGEYGYYDKVAVYRAPLSAADRACLVQEACKEVGRPYDPFSAISDERTEYCSKLIWRCFRSIGIEICKPDAWVLPDDIAASPRLQCIAEWTPAQS